MTKKICPFMAIIYYTAANGRMDLGQGWDAFCIGPYCEFWNEEVEKCSMILKS